MTGGQKVPIRPLGSRHREELERLLAAGGPADAFLADAVDGHMLRGFLGAFDGSRLVGALRIHAGGVCAARRTPVPVATALARAIPRGYRWSSVVGPEEPCAAAKDVLAAGAPPRVDRVQVFMWTGPEDQRCAALPGLRPARTEDLPQLVPMVAAYRFEDGLSDDRGPPTSWLRRYVSERITAGHVYVAEQGGRIVFTGAFNFLGARGAGLGGIYTLPEARSRGLASRGTASLVRIGLATAPVVNLHVDRGNEPALRCYEKAGLKRDGFYRLAFR